MTRRTPPRPVRVMLLAKSPWHPAVRREHALASALTREGHDVTFVERGRDLRDLSSRPATPARPSAPRVVSRFAPVPGHHDVASWAVETALLASRVRRLAREERYDAVVVNAPWNWRAATIGAPPGVRLVLDIADDWADLLPRRRQQMLRMYESVSDEANAIIGVAPGLQRRFRQQIITVPNAVAPELLAVPATRAPGHHRMAYVGTLSERFDCALMAEVLERLPQWRLDLYGHCRYAGAGQQPSAELARLLQTPGGRARWHGPVDRDDQVAVLDAADVLVLPNVPALTDGQDPMKLYDYAARQRPIVATWMRLPDSTPPGLVRAGSAGEFADAVANATRQEVTGNRRWAEANSWTARVPDWLGAVMGWKS